MSKGYVAFLLLVLLFSLFITKYYGYNSCIAKSDKTDYELCKCDYDYHININDSGSIIYSSNGEFVDYLPFDSTQALDKAFLKDNL